MALPLVPMIAWQSQTTAETGAWFQWLYKTRYFLTTLRDRWQAFDVASLGLIFGIIVVPLALDRVGYSRMLMTSTILLLIVFLLLPRVIFGSAYADMRLTPMIFTMAILSVRPHHALSAKVLGRVALLGLCFFAARTIGTTASLAISSARWNQALGALDHVPRGARIAAFNGWSCTFDWQTERLEHVAGLAIVRKHAFSNDQWQVSGTSFMTVIKPDAPGFTSDPSQLVTAAPCRGGEWRTLDDSLRLLPRRAFDFVWLIDPPRFDTRLTNGMTLVWANGPDRLYRLAPR